MSQLYTASFTDLIKKRAAVFAKALNNVVNPTFKGGQNPLKYTNEISALAKLKRQPFPRQARLITAAAEHLAKNDSLIISAEMGTGKTQMGISVAYLFSLFNKNKAQKVMIMCPTHLVSKWADEIEKVLGKGEKALIPYQIVIVKRWDDLVGYRQKALQNKTYFFILSKETAKLSYPRKACYIEKKRIITTNDEMTGETIKTYSWQYTCPDCGFIHDEDTKQLSEPKIPRKCECGSVLRQVDRGKPSNDRLSVAEYIKKQFPKGWIDLLLLDELHELKGGDTGQGNAFGMIASMAKKCVGLTGTLLNGYASSLFYILYRMNPKLMKQLKLDYKDVERFVELYGAREETYEARETNNEGKVTKKGKKIAVKELPRISPYLLTLLLPFTIFLRLDEMNIPLPDYEEIVDLVGPDENWVEEYKSYISSLAREVKDDKRVLGALANDAISVCDLPFMDFAPKFGQATYKAPVSKDFITAKEKKLVERVREELSEGRKCLLFATYTNLGVSERLEELLSNEFPQFKIRALPSSVEASKREKWIKDNPCDVLISNPELVKTGLDLLEYPTIIFYQTTYNVFTLKQAARRSWRIGQTKNVKVIFMAYDETAQRTALSLISKKIAAANSLEGRLSLGNDLAGLEEDDASMQVQLAKAIMTGAMSEEIETSKWTFTSREWDKFEKAYIEAKDKTESIINDVAETVEAEDNLVEALENEVLLSSNIDESDNVVEESANNKITIYRRVRRGKGFVEESVEATTAEIQAMVQAETGPIQLSLF
jgi:SNF2 family DNA or RNA helicase